MSDNLLAKPVGKLLIIDRDGPGFISCILDKERVTFGRCVDAWLDARSSTALTRRHTPTNLLHSPNRLMTGGFPQEL